MKRLSAALLLVLLTLMLPIGVLAEAAEDTLADKTGTYRIEADGTLTLVDAANDAYVTIPGTIKGHTVTAIGSGAFCDHRDTKYVAIPSTVRRIESNAFLFCSRLEEVLFSEGTEEIGTEAFSGCCALRSIELPRGLKRICDKAFMNCYGITELMLPETLTELGVWAFNGCSGITELTIPGSIEVLRSSAFGRCTGLRSVTIESGVRTMEGAFFYCQSLETVSVPDSVTEISENEFSRCGASLRLICTPGSAARQFAEARQLLVTEAAEDGFDVSRLTPRQLVNYYSGELDNDGLERIPGEPCYTGRLLIAIRRDEETIELLSKGNGYHSIPDELLTDDPAQADTLVFITRKREVVGSYSGGGAAMKTTTLVDAIELATGRAYQTRVIAVNDPPSTISVTVINGTPTGGSGSGAFEEEKAADYILEHRSEVLSDASASGEADETPEADGSFDVFSILRDELYRDTYAELASGATVAKGSKGSAAKGVQQTLRAFGIDIDADGSFGARSLRALNELRTVFGEDEVDAVTADGYRELLLWLAFTTEPDAMADTETVDNAAEYTYLRACVSELQGRSAEARALFAQTDHRDARQRAVASRQARPERGELYRNPDYTGRKTRLTLEVHAEDEKTCTLFKLYAENGDMVSCIFIDGSNSAAVKLPSGTYMIKMGIGTEWYGLEDAFGDSGSYSVMTFDGGEQHTTLASGYEYTLIINTMDSSGDSVGSVGVSRSDF